VHDLYGKLWKCLPVGGHANKKKGKAKKGTRESNQRENT
jgi:hypothetical protein